MNMLILYILHEERHKFGGRPAVEVVDTVGEWRRRDGKPSVGEVGAEIRVFRKGGEGAVAVGGQADCDEVTSGHGRWWKLAAVGVGSP